MQLSILTGTRALEEGMGRRQWPVPGLMGKGKSEAKLEMRGALFVCTEPESELRLKLQHSLNNLFSSLWEGRMLDLRGGMASLLF